MTNRQWLMNEMQNMSDEELAEILASESGICDTINKECVNETCTNCTLNWLKSEHKEKPKLSDAERVILENVDENYKWIARNEKNVLFVYAERPIKREDYWLNTTMRYAFHLEPFNHLFQFIKWEDTEPYNIEELLKGE